MQACFGGPGDKIEVDTKKRRGVFMELLVLVLSYGHLKSVNDLSV